jgi:hypothetical protein
LILKTARDLCRAIIKPVCDIFLKVIYKAGWTRFDLRDSHAPNMDLIVIVFVFLIAVAGSGFYITRRLKRRRRKGRKIKILPF